MNKRSTYRLFRSPIWPALLSGFVVPGLGQIMNGEYKKGFILAGSIFGSFYWFFKVIGDRLSLIAPAGSQEWYENPNAFKEPLIQLFKETPEMFLLFYTLVFLIIGYSIVDAFLTARQLNRKRIPKHVIHDDSDLDR